MGKDSLKITWSRVFFGKPLPLLLKTAKGHCSGRMRRQSTKRSIEYFSIIPGKSCSLYEMGQQRWVLAGAA